MTATPRATSWNAAMAAHPGDLDLEIPASAIDGEVPSALRGGTMWSNGPGWTRIGDHTAHPFDGHGYLRRFQFAADGSCSLRARFVQTPSYRAEKEAGAFVHRGFATNLPKPFWHNLRSGPPRNVANTTIVPFGDTLLAGWEAGSPYSIDPDTLETLGEQHFDGAIKDRATLAHFRLDAATQQLTLCNVKMGRHTTLTFRDVAPDGTTHVASEATLEQLLFIHDYALTPNLFVVGGNPLRLQPLELAKSLAGLGTFLTSVAPDVAQAGTLHLLSRHANTPVRTVALPGPAFVVHFGNAFEQEDGTLVVDASVFEEFTFGEEFGYQGTDRPFDAAAPDRRRPQRLMRITVPPGSTDATWEPLTDQAVDFPRFHPDHEGRETPLLFGATRKDKRHSDPFDTLIGIDLLTPGFPSQLWTAPDNTFVGEPLFAPSTDDDAQGHVLAVISDGLGGKTTLAVFDARDLPAGPIARVPLPLLPIAFHGCWTPPVSTRT